MYRQESRNDQQESLENMVLEDNRISSTETDTSRYDENSNSCDSWLQQIVHSCQTKQALTYLPILHKKIWNYFFKFALQHFLNTIVKNECFYDQNTLSYSVLELLKKCVLTQDWPLFRNRPYFSTIYQSSRIEIMKDQAPHSCFVSLNKYSISYFLESFLVHVLVV